MAERRGQQEIRVRGAREHNLRGLDVAIPRGSLAIISGVSGSGKSSLAFDTIFKEGQRRFVESLSAYARQFLGQGEKPRVEQITGLSPAVSIDQKGVNRNPRSTVGTITEIYDHLRLLFARLGRPHCPEHGLPVEARTAEEVVELVLKTWRGQQVMVLAPLVRERKGEYRKDLAELRAQGYVRARIDGKIRRLDEPLELERYERHSIEVVLDRILVTSKLGNRLGEAVEAALKLGQGSVGILQGSKLESFSSKQACPRCGATVPEMEPRLFSHNSPLGACPECDGLGTGAVVSLDCVIPDRELSIDQGAVLPSVKGGWQLRRFLRPEILQQVCGALKVRRGIPWKKLTKREQRCVLEGGGGRRVLIHTRFEGPRLRVRRDERMVWEGVLPLIQRLYDRRPSGLLARFMAPGPCPSCGGARLRPEALAVRFQHKSIAELAALTVDELIAFLAGLTLRGRELAIGKRLVKELKQRLLFLSRVGLGYLGVDRSAASLSGGEAQRIRLAAQAGSGLRGILYVLDEPSIGLHQRDNRRLLETLRELRDGGNTVLVVEHDQESIEAADHVVDVGPGAGSLGGKLVVSGPPADLWKNPLSVTGAFLSGREEIPRPAQVRTPGGRRLVVRGAREHNLRGIDVPFPLGLFCVVTGVSGSGKSTLVDSILKRALARRFHGALDLPGEHAGIDGLEYLDKVIEISQTPIGRTPRSNPATYTGLLDLIRELYARLPESSLRGYKKGRFSFNVKGGRCEECQGAGIKWIEMHFLPDVEILCDACAGKRFNPETLEIHFKGKSIGDVLAMTVAEALDFFRFHKRIAHILETLCRVGLQYVQLGQPSTTLSGGEAQRVKLARYLHRPPTGRTLYLLDEPTTGLHFLDIRRLVAALQALVEQGNTVVVIEHNLDVVKCADWIVDLGPEGGDGGGDLLYAGPLPGILLCSKSHTGRVLKEHFARSLKPPRRSRRKLVDKALEGDIVVRGAALHNLRQVNVRIPAGSLTVVTGPSGSGKTSLAFDTLFAEGQRRFVECLSTYARQFLGRLARPPFESIQGLAPAIAIDQKNTGRNPRSTVATVTEIHDFLRVLYARVGQPHCPVTGVLLLSHPPHGVYRDLLQDFAGKRGRLLAPLYLADKHRPTLLQKPAQLRQLLPELKEQGFRRLFLDGQELRLEEKLPALAGLREIMIVVDRVLVKSSSRSRILDSVGQAYERGLGALAFETLDGKRRWYTEKPGSVESDFYLEHELNPRMFSFNSHHGACPLCHGLGQRLACDPKLLVDHPELPLFGGALADKPGGFISRRGSYLRRVVEQTARKLELDLDEPWKTLPQAFRRFVLNGQKKELQLSFHSRRNGGQALYEIRTHWKGFCRYVEHWHETTESQSWAAALEQVMGRDRCQACGGERLKPAYRAVTLEGKRLGEVGRMTVAEALAWVQGMRLQGVSAKIAREARKELEARLKYLQAVGLAYLTLDRGAATLSGGEAQRIRLATQIGNRLTGVIYVLDEPTIGLHPRDTKRLLDTLDDLKRLGNTVVVVEHDRDTMERADWIVDLGPGAGAAGGKVVYQGDRAGLSRARSLTADYLEGRRVMPVPSQRRTPSASKLLLQGACTNNLRDITLAIPRGLLCVVTGVSGSGKSSLVMDTLAPAIKVRLQGKQKLTGLASLRGTAGIERAIIVDQSPIGTSPRSNPASYIGILDEIRKIMAETTLARIRGFGAGRFSFNLSEGRCAGCNGRGSIKVEMHFLPDIWMTCEDCQGRRFNRRTLEVEYRGKTIADVLEMEVSQALRFFGNRRRMARPLKLLQEIGLGYLKLGQAANTLSGGEAQRIKLARELAKRSAGEILYLLDEPTTGLHFDDVARLVGVLHKLVENGHSVVVIEHNLDVIWSADWVIDLGPEGGEAGGLVVAAGAPEALVSAPDSHTGRALKRFASLGLVGSLGKPKERKPLERVC